MRPTRRRSPRGQAAVEMAVLMIVLVPLIMYALFLEDLLFYHFDQQEAVTSSPWDVGAFDLRHQGKDFATTMGTAQHFNRLTYADHSSASNNYQNPSKDTNDEGHHQAVAAHQCWLANGGQQVTLSVGSNSFIELSEFGYVPTDSGGPSGGLVTSSAILGVQNYFLPQKFMNDYWGTKNQMTNEARWTDGTSIHGNAKEDTYTFPKDSLMVLHDNYALNYIRASFTTFPSKSDQRKAEHDDGKLDSLKHPMNLTSELTDWTKAVWDSSATDKATKFADEATKKKILTDKVKNEPEGDDLGTPSLTWSKDPGKTFSNDTAPSGMGDQRVKDTYGSRQEAYLGRAESTW